MRPNHRSRLLCFALVVVVIVVIREISIRRHLGDLEAWPDPA